MQPWQKVVINDNETAAPHVVLDHLAELTWFVDHKSHNDGALCDVRTPRRQRCSKKLSSMHL